MTLENTSRDLDYDRKAERMSTAAKELRCSAADCMAARRGLFAQELMAKAKRYEALATAYRERDLLTIAKFEDEMALLSRILE